MMGKLRNKVKRFDYPLPNGLKEINEVFGNPDKDGNFELDGSFIKAKLKRFKFPFPMRLSWDSSRYMTHFSAHSLVGVFILDALREIRFYKGYGFLKDNGWDFCGGVYCFRKMGSYPALSTHSWGIAIDINPHLGRYGEEPKMPQFIVDAFKKRGFEWGGDWPSKNPKWKFDGMHFQMCTGY